MVKKLGLWLYRIVIPLSVSLLVLLISPIYWHGHLAMSGLELAIRVILTLYLIGLSWGTSNIIAGVWETENLLRYMQSFPPSFLILGVGCGTMGFLGITVAMSVMFSAISLLLFPGIGLWSLGFGILGMLLVMPVAGIGLFRVAYHSLKSSARVPNQEPHSGE